MRKRNLKPKSDLQKLQFKTNWLVYFKLHPIAYHLYNKLDLSDITLYQIDRYNRLTSRLKESLLIDLKNNKKRILKDRENFIQGEN